MFQTQSQTYRQVPMAYKRLPKVLGFYELPGNIDENLADVNRKLKVKCKFCPKSIVGSVRVTSNFITHLKKAHQQINAEYEQEKKSNFDFLSKKLKVAIDSPSPEPKLFRPEISRTSSGNSTDETKKERIDSLLVKFIAKTALNSSVVLNNDFVNLVHELCPSYDVPTVAELLNGAVPDLVAKISDTIRKIFDECESVTLSVETWTEPLLGGYFGKRDVYFDAFLFYSL